MLTAVYQGNMKIQIFFPTVKFLVLKCCLSYLKSHSKADYFGGKFLVNINYL